MRIFFNRMTFVEQSYNQVPGCLVVEPLPRLIWVIYLVGSPVVGVIENPLVLLPDQREKMQTHRDEIGSHVW